MNIYTETDYRIILRNAVEERKKVTSKFNFQKMAEEIRVQKSYLSRVLNGMAELSSDQLFLACEYVEFSEKQRSYMELLLEWTRCSLKKRKDFLNAQIRMIQEKHRETKEHLSSKELVLNSSDAELYYLDPIHQLVHLCLTMDCYQQDLSALAKDLRLPPTRILSAVNKLEQLNIIKRSHNGIKVLIHDIHLPRDSHIYQAWRSQLKILSMHRLLSASLPNDYSFSVVFSADEIVQEKLRAKFLEFLKEVEPWVKKAPSHGAFQMSFDLFRWT